MWRGPGTLLRSLVCRLAPGVAASQCAATSDCGRSKHDVAEAAKKEEQRRAQYGEAMAWCQENQCSAYAATQRKADGTDSSRWPLISERGLRDRLCGAVDNSRPYANKAVLTQAEDDAIVAACIDLSRHSQGIDRKSLGEMVLESLELRPLLNRGRHYIPLSVNAQNMLDTGKVGHEWFTTFFAKHPSIAERHPCAEEIARARWMTKANSLLHFQLLQETLERAGILSDGKILDPRRILNSDECPNPFGGTGGRGSVIAPVGEPCRKLISSARQHTSLDACIALDGFLFDPHLIFSGQYIQRQMVPNRKNVPNSVISVTEKGYQTGATLLKTLQHWDEQLKARGVPKPVVWMTDGHASRLSLAVLKWCRDNQWIMYLSPPHTTGIHQPLDQIFKNWHSTFNKKVGAWCDANTGREVDKARFAELFSEAWPIWTRSDSIVAAFRRCGVSVNGLDSEAIPKQKFVVSTVMAASTSAVEVEQHDAPSTMLSLPPPTARVPSTGASSAAPSSSLTAPSSEALVRPTPPTAAAEDAPNFAVVLGEQAALIDDTEAWKSPSPARNEWSTRAQYWEIKAKLASQAARGFRTALARLQHVPVTLATHHPSFQPRKAEELPAEEKAKGKQTIKGRWGDMDTQTLDGKSIIQYLEDRDREEEARLDEADKRKREQAERKAEREAEEQRKRNEKAIRVMEEVRVTDLLKSLRYIEPNDDEVSAAGLIAFVKANRAHLRALGIEVPAQPSRKALMPILVAQIEKWPAGIAWAAALPRALLGPSSDEDATQPQDEAMNDRTSAESLDAPRAEPRRAEDSDEEQPLCKRTRRSTTAAGS